MKKHLFIVFLLLLSSFQVESQTIKKVMFLGNSYTFVNDLPTTVSVLAKSAGDSLYFDSSTPGGYTFQGHSTNTASLNLIQQGGWDMMVLQEQSQLPSFPISQVMSQSYPFAQSLCNNFYQYNPCGKPLFFMTWGRKNGDQSNCATWPPVCSYAGMDSLLNLRYRMMADSNHALVSPVGAVWHYIRTHHPNIELYDTDQSHPSPAGTYVAACTFYSLIFQKDPTNIKDDQSLSATVAMDIRNAAKLIAFDSLAKWNMGKFDPLASFSFTRKTDTIYFQNNSDFAVDYLWHFGDGDTANILNPMHIYKSSGTYKVILEAKNCNLIDTTSISVTILPNGIKPIDKVVVEIYPNPATSIIYLLFDMGGAPKEIELYDLQGRQVKKFILKGNPRVALDISELESGVYFVSFSLQGVLHKYKVMKIR